MKYRTEEYVADGDRADYFQYQYQDYPHPVQPTQPTGDRGMNNVTNSNKRIDKKDWMIIGGVLASTALIATLFGGGGRPRVAPQYAQPQIGNGTVTIPGNGGQPTVINFDND